MTFRRRHRWLRRLALGLAVAIAVSAGVVPSAAAKNDEGMGTAASVAEGQLLSQAPAVDVAATRPDDLARRFSHSDVPSQPVLASSDTWTFDRTDAVILAVGSFVLVLGLGLALGYLRRPRLAGF